MDKIVEILIASSPVLAVVLLLGRELITAIRDVAAAQVQASIEREDMRKRLERLEVYLMGLPSEVAGKNSTGS